MKKPSAKAASAIFIWGMVWRTRVFAIGLIGGRTGHGPLRSGRAQLSRELD